MDDLALATCQIMLSIFGLLAFAIDGFAHAAEALVGEAIGRKSPTMLRIVIRRTNYLAGMMALLLSVLLWAGQPLILLLMTSVTHDEPTGPDCICRCLLALGCQPSAGVFSGLSDGWHFCWRDMRHPDA